MTKSISCCISKDVREPASSYYAGFMVPAKCNAAGAQLALDDSSRVEWPPKSLSSVKRLAASRHSSAFIRRTGWTSIVALSRWQDKKYCP